MASKLRRRRLVPLLLMIDSIFEKHGEVNIVDIGGTKTYWNIVPYTLLEEKNIHITLVNLPGSKPHDDEERFSYIEADGCDLSTFEDNSFHIAHSNSVVEHVGDWSRMVRFAGEISRCAEKYFVQSPNYWFPIEPHCMTPFFHWLPKPLRVWLVLKFQLGHWKRAETMDSAVRTVERARLLDKQMFRELFKDAEIVTERFLLLPKSFVAIKS
jgi:hypothetical protein